MDYCLPAKKWCAGQHSLPCSGNGGIVHVRFCVWRSGMLTRTHQNMGTFSFWSLAQERSLSWGHDVYDWWMRVLFPMTLYWTKNMDRDMFAEQLWSGESWWHTFVYCVSFYGRFCSCMLCFLFSCRFGGLLAALINSPKYYSRDFDEANPCNFIEWLHSFVYAGVIQFFFFHFEVPSDYFLTELGYQCASVVLVAFVVRPLNLYQNLLS